MFMVKTPASIFLSFIAILTAVSCGNETDPGIICSLKKDRIIMMNSKTTLSVDNNLTFTISLMNKGKNICITSGQGKSTSVCLADSAGNMVSFSKRSAVVEDISDKNGDGKRMLIDAESGDGKILCKIFLSSYIQFPDMILVQASFKNISGKNTRIRGYKLAVISLQPSGADMKWWSFQGAAYKWGQDFAFPLPDSFSRDNNMILNAVKAGGGIPLVDFWNKEYGLALACLSDKPEPVSLPVSAMNGFVNISVRDSLTNRILIPGDSLVSVQTAIIVHHGDFFDPIKTYSEFMQGNFLNDFQKPGNLAYEPEWCTWGYRQDFRPGLILNKLDTLKALGIKSVILDDGWSLSHGDWLPDPAKFPEGDRDFKKLVNTLHERGFKVWIWWVPGYVDSTTTIAGRQREWLVKNDDGSVHPSYALCPAYAPVQEHYRNLVRKFIEDYRLDGLKLDFGEINSAPPCYDSTHKHNDPFDSFRSTPLLFENICKTAKQYNPDILLEYCPCSLPPSIFHLPYINLAVTSDPKISQITQRIKMYKALLGPDFPVLEEYCGVLAGPVYQLVSGTGGVPGTFSTYLDNYHNKWMNLYREYQLSRGEYLNLYDMAFDYPEGHVIKKDGSIYYAFYTHPWERIESKRWFRYGNEFDSKIKVRTENDFPEEPYSGRVELRGLDRNMKYQVLNYETDSDLGIIPGDEPSINVSFINYLLLKVTPLVP